MSEQVSESAGNLSSCQKCGKDTPNLSQLDSGLKLSLVKTGQDDVPSLVCKSCLKELKGVASLGAQKQAKAEIKAGHKAKIWQSRLDLVRHGRSFLQRKEYAASAVSYEKYLKVLSIVMEQNTKDLDPKYFNDNPKEITIISSVLWDLMLIYDSHTKFAVKQKESAELLAKFLRYSPVYNSIVRKAELEVKKSKNPQAYKDLLKLCDVQATRCFIANSAFETRTHPTVKTLCNFRDQVLKKSLLGRAFVYTYYKHSPLLAVFLDTRPHLKRLLRLVLRGVGIVVKILFRLPDA